MTPTQNATSTLTSVVDEEAWVLAELQNMAQAVENSRSTSTSRTANATEAEATAKAKATVEAAAASSFAVVAAAEAKQCRFSASPGDRRISHTGNLSGTHALLPIKSAQTAAIHKDFAHHKKQQTLLQTQTRKIAR